MPSDSELFAIISNRGPITRADLDTWAGRQVGYVIGTRALDCAIDRLIAAKRIQRTDPDSYSTRHG
jgi:chromosome segregation and condensation protein ScpB